MISDDISIEINKVKLIFVSDMFFPHLLSYFF